MPIRIKTTNLVYFPVPKIACTSIKTAILANNDFEMLKVFETNVGEGRYRQFHDLYPSKNFQARSLFGKIIGRKWVAVVRDPVQRAVSGYRNRILYHRDLGETSPQDLARLALPETPDLNTFAINLGAYSSVNPSTRHHFAPLTCFLGKKPERFARIFRLSELDQFVGFVEKHGVRLTLPHEQSGGPAIGVDDLTDAAHAALLAFYREDYEIWGDYF